MQKQPETPSEIIKAARDKSDLTVEELTDRVGITERYLYRIENEGKVPTFEVLKKIVREWSSARLLPLGGCAVSHTPASQ